MGKLQTGDKADRHKMAAAGSDDYKVREWWEWWLQAEGKGGAGGDSLTL